MAGGKSSIDGTGWRARLCYCSPDLHRDHSPADFSLTPYAASSPRSGMLAMKPSLSRTRIAQYQIQYMRRFPLFEQKASRRPPRGQQHSAAKVASLETGARVKI